MAIKLVPVKCPECGAMLNIEENRTQAFCSYCGAKVLIHNENEFTYRHVDVADLERAETERVVQLKKMELAEKENSDKKTIRNMKIFFSVLFFVSGVIMIPGGFLLGDKTGNPDSGFYMLSIVGLIVVMAAGVVGASLASNKNEEDRDNSRDNLEGKIKVPVNAFNYQFKSYTAIAAILESAGFTNIRCVPLNDLLINVLMFKPGMVESIVIDGQIAIPDKKYPKDALVVISYHSKA